MLWYLNDVSLQNQFTGNIDKFFEIFKDLLVIQNRYTIFKENFCIIEEIGNSKIQHDLSLRDVLFRENRAKYANIRVVILKLLASATPYAKLKSQMHGNTATKYLYKSVDVTESAIAIVAQNVANKIDCALFSFLGGPIDFEFNQLDVELRVSDSKSEICKVLNFFEINSLEKNIKSVLPSSSWRDLNEIIKQNFANLELNENIFAEIENQSYNNIFKDKILELLNVLNEFMNNRPNGKNNSTANEIVMNHFSGGKKFSDESETNKKKYSKDLTFSSLHGEEVFAPWHGKFSLLGNEYRIHFEWPIKKKRKKMEIFYIGTKITTK